MAKRLIKYSYQRFVFYLNWQLAYGIVDLE